MYTYRSKVLILFVALILTGCSGGIESSQSSGSGNTAASSSVNTSIADSATPADMAPVSSDSATTAQSSRLCALFTTAEIIDMLGAPVGDGKVAGPQDTACHWSGSTDAAAIYAQVQVVNDTSYWSTPDLGEGYKELTGIATEAYVIPELGGWAAGALTDNAIFTVAMNGGKASSDSTVNLLRLLMERAK